VTAKAALLAALEPTFAGLTVDEVVTALEEVGVPVGPVRDIGAVLADGSTAQRRLLLEFDRSDVTGVRVVNTPWKIDGVAPALRCPPPHLGEHTADVLAELSRRDVGRW
jgi:formyl-CoA transferase